ncbi:MAG: enoyl-CoA hydratase/isomerase family protein [Acidimicrobiales bacterium]
METLQIERAGGVVTVTLNRPEKKNAINQTMWDELEATLAEIVRATDDRVVVITGAGGAFCSGQDLSDPATDRHRLRRMRRVADVAAAVRRLEQPVIAAVGGVAAGAGLSLALAADLIVASDEARFSTIFARRGLTLDFGSSWLLPRLIGLHRAKELALFGDVIDAREAERLGLVNRVVPTAEFDKLVGDWAARLAAGPPLALSMTKRLLNQSFEMSFEETLEAEAMAQTVNFGTADIGEAMAAFVDKREPRFQGR